MVRGSVGWRLQATTTLIALQGAGEHIAVRAGVEGLDVSPTQGRALAAQLDQAAIVVVQHVIPVGGIPGGSSGGSPGRCRRRAPPRRRSRWRARPM